MTTSETMAGEMNWASLITAVAIMLIGSIYPILFTSKTGEVSHGAVALLCWAMSAGFVSGVGFIPKNKFLKILFSGWACAICCVVAIGLIRLA